MLNEDCLKYANNDKEMSSSSRSKIRSDTAILFRDGENQIWFETSIHYHTFLGKMVETYIIFPTKSQMQLWSASTLLLK